MLHVINLLRQQKLVADLNDLFKYIININTITKRKRTMLIRPLNLKQFGQGVNEKHV
jgi:hypothetical protein